MTRAVVWSTLAGLALYVGHAALLGSWIVDDAGISFAYARNLASGYGLVAQPGAAPVEGCTNLAWVVLLALTMQLHLFDPVWTPKILAAICVAVALAGTGHLCSARGLRPGWLIGAALMVPALCSGFVIWCASGLENALYVVLVVMLGLVTVARPATPAARDRQAAGAGITLFVLFCTRPDAAFYFWIPAFLIGLATPSSKRPLGIYVGTFIGLWLLLTLFRGVYFHDIFPNTFYAKKGEGAKIFAWLLTRLPLAAAVGTVMAVGTLVIAAIGWGFHALGRRLATNVASEFDRRWMLVFLFLTAYAIVLALPGDWMLEHRFATPMFLFGPAAGLTLGWEVLARARRRNLFVGIAAAATLGVAGVYSARHTPAFVVAPALAFDAVRANSLRIAAALAPRGADATVLSPDIGGALWENRFRVLDLVGLTDRPLGRDIRRDRDTIARHILETRRPEGVWVHTFWMGVTGFDTDPAFAAAYRPAWEDRPAPGAPAVAGFYLRRDLDGAVEGGARSDWSVDRVAAESVNDGAVAEPAPTPATYTVRMVHVAPPKLSVTANLPMASDALEMNTTRPGGIIAELDTGGWPSLVANLRVSDPTGRKLELTSVGTKGWKLAQPVSGRIDVEYEVDYALLAARAWMAPREAGLEDSSHVVLVGRSLFVTTQATTACIVRFEPLPAWSAVTPWEPMPGSAQEFTATNPGDLTENLFVLTRFAPDVVTAGGLRLLVTSMGPWQPARAEVQRVLGAVVPRLAGMMRVESRSNYLVVLLPTLEQGGESYRRSFALTQEAPPSRTNSATWGNTIAHETFHQWNGWGLRGADYTSTQWFQEGFTEYAANVAMVAAKLVSPEQFEQKLGVHVRQSRQLTTSLEAIGTHKGPPLYSAGALVALVWDLQIRAATKNERDLWDFMSELWRRTEPAQHVYEWKDIHAALEATAPLDWDGFHRSYIEGREPLPLDQALSMGGLRLGAADTVEIDSNASAAAKKVWQGLITGE